MALIAGTAADMAGSMAAAIEQAFLEEWPNIMNSGAPASNPQMKLLFLAVAKGVVRHLVAHPEAFVITFDDLSDLSKLKAKVAIKSTEAP